MVTNCMNARTAECGSGDCRLMWIRLRDPDVQLESKGVADDRHPFENADEIEWVM